MATAPTATWARKSEQAALTLHPALLAQAQENSRTRADTALLMGLAREIALTRGPELTRGYRNVVMVQPGFKKQREGDREVLTREPCVVFVVRRKWRPGRAVADAAQQLPTWLVTFAELGGQRLPFALRTDVQPASAFSGATAHGAGSVWLQPAGLALEHGAVACAVRVRQPGAGSQTCLLSAQHVFTPAADVAATAVQGGEPALPMDADGVPLPQPVVATTQPWGGELRGDEDPAFPSFDVQLAAADSVAAARQVVGARRLNAAEPFVRTPERLWALGATHWFHLLVPDNNGGPPARGPLQAQLDAPMTLPFPLSYRLRRNGVPVLVDLYHDELVKLQVTAAPFARAGDSGCAVVVMHADGTVTLAGLYLGGDGDAAYALPAWQLFDPARWWQLPSGATLTPVSL